MPATQANFKMIQIVIKKERVRRGPIGRGPEIGMPNRIFFEGSNRKFEGPNLKFEGPNRKFEGPNRKSRCRAPLPDPASQIGIFFK